MELRPCIDIHNGKVKQLVGGSIQDQGDSAQENYISSQDAAWYARLFQEKGLKNGHVILLNSKDSAYYEQTRQQALSALQAYPGGLQVGGGITEENAEAFATFVLYGAWGMIYNNKFTGSGEAYDLENILKITDQLFY